MTFCRFSLLIRESFFINALRKCVFYSSLFQLPLASILFSIFLLCLYIVKNPVVINFIAF